jgi:serine protease AprX
MFVWDNKTMLILMAAGNEGIDANSDGVVDADSMSSPGTAKNCLTVGAAENYRAISSTWGASLAF